MKGGMVIRSALIGLLTLSAIFINVPQISSEAGVASLFPSLVGSCEEGKLCVSYFYIGQGDATLIESPTGTQVLIDGGPDSSVLRELGRRLGFFDRDLDMIIATHPDMDHIGGLVDVLSRYETDLMLISGNESDTPVASAFNGGLQDEGSEIIEARVGDIFDLGRGATLEVLFPDRDVSNLESNTASIVARLTYGDTCFLFMGDAPESIEEYLVAQYGDRLACDVLKVGHHGSDTSTSEIFLEAVNPALAIISAGRDNRYGHPHKSVLERLKADGIPYENTAESGSITVISDGEEIRVID